MSVRNRIGKAVGSIIVATGGIGDGAIGIINHGTIGWGSISRDAQGTTIKIAVVTEQGAGGDDQSGIFIGIAGRIIHGGWCIITTSYIKYHTGTSRGFVVGYLDCETVGNCLSCG